MNIEILVDSDIELYDERVKPSSVRACGEKNGARGEIEGVANREQAANGVQHIVEFCRVFQSSLHIAGEYVYLPSRELVCIAGGRYTLR